MLDYRFCASPFVHSTVSSRRRGGLARKTATVGAIYGTAAGVGYLAGGPVGATAGIVLVPEAIVIPLVVLS